VFKNQLIWPRTLGEEAFGFGATLPQVKIANNWHCCNSMEMSGSLKAKQRASQFVYRLVFVITRRIQGLYICTRLGCWNWAVYA